MKKKRKKGLSVLEAVDNLSNLAELDVETKKETSWLDPKKIDDNQERIKATFEILNDYLRHLYQKERVQLADPQTQRAVRAMMQLADEAIDKVEKYTDIFKGTVGEKEAPIPEYQQLQQFYLSKIVTKLKKEKDQPLEKESPEQEQTALDIERQALKDLESVRRDKEYELFYIYKEDGMPFFNPNLLRHVRLVGNFDESLTSTEVESPLKRMDIVLDRDFHSSAKEILKEAEAMLREFYEEALKYKEMTFVSLINMSLMGLMMAANPKNLSHNTAGKKSCDYFTDFERYLREALKTEEYRRLLATSSEDLEPFFRCLLKVAHSLCGFLFLRIGSHGEVLSLIRQLVEGKTKTLPSFWATLAYLDETIREELKKFPSGPVLKVLSTFREEEEREGFDPILQHNPPGQLFSIASETMHMTFLHLPCPTHQEFIDKAGVVEEFKGFLRYLGQKRHLLVNLQDRTSWKEHHRSHCLEELPKEAQFGQMLRVVTLPKDTDFYNQAQEYAELNDGKEFCSVLQEQIASGEQCGFFIPADLSTDTKKLINFIYENFFESKKTLSRKERLDFIEIFYFFLMLVIIDKEQPDTVSFTCKDGIDTGAAASSGFYGYARMLSSSKPWTEEDKNFFLFSLYGPSLLVRHRAIDSQRYNRMISSLEQFENSMKSRRDKILKACANLFPDFPIEKLKVTEAA